MFIIKDYQPETFNKVIDVFGGGATITMWYLQEDYNVVYNDLNEDQTLLMFLLKEGGERLDKIIKDYNEVVNK